MDRLSILKALSAKSQALMGRVSHGDLQVIANATEGFTGADLQALLYTAQLNGIHRAAGKTAVIRLPH